MFTRKSTILAIAALMGATAGTSVLAEMGPGGENGPGRMLEEMFATVDANSDGKVTMEELEAHRMAKFTAADANGDGKLDTDEAIAFQKAEIDEMIARRAARMIERHDDDGDGAISADEIDESPVEERFAVIDTDNDGAISQEEAEALAQRFADREGRRMHDHKGGGMGSWFN